MQQMTPVQLKEYLELASPAPLLLDVREEWEFDICSLQGSLLVPMSQIQSKLETLDPALEIVVICHHGIRSAHICRFLEHHGYHRTINLSGGVDAWAQQVDINMAVY